MPEHVQRFNNVPSGSSVELEVETDDSPWAAKARVIVSNEPSRKFTFSTNSKGPKDFVLTSPKVAFIDWTVAFQGTAKLKLWRRVHRPDGTVHKSVSRELSGKAGDTLFHSDLVVSEA